MVIISRYKIKYLLELDDLFPRSLLVHEVIIYTDL